MQQPSEPVSVRPQRLGPGSGQRQPQDAARTSPPPHDMITAVLTHPSALQEAQIMTLREHLLNSQSQQSSSGGATQDGMHSAASHDHHIDPAIAGPGYPVPINDGGVEDQVHEVRKGRRELSTSKRAAQNRAAQRAFRQRKEAYINSLQEKVKEYETMIGNYKAVQQENFQLREYIIQLQARLLEAHTDVPPPPAQIDLTNPPQRPDDAPQTAAPTAQMTSNAVEELRLAAAAAEQAAGITTGSSSSGQDRPSSSGDRK